MGGRTAPAVELKLLLDEMHSRAVAARLRALGHDVVAVKERPDLIGLNDEELFSAARDEDRAVVTEDLQDFAAIAKRWSAAGTHHAGLVLTHPYRFPRGAGTYVRTLSDALAQLLDEVGPTLADVASFAWWLQPARRSR